MFKIKLKAREKVHPVDDYKIIHSHQNVTGILRFSESASYFALLRLKIQYFPELFIILQERKASAHTGHFCAIFPFCLEKVPVINKDLGRGFKEVKTRKRLSRAVGDVSECSNSEHGR